MKYYKMKIREKFLPLILNCKKKHEYRVATPNRLAIKVGDILVLVSNQDSSKYIRAYVTDVKRYSDWDGPLNLYWEQDFSDMYSSKDAVIEDLHRFYGAQDIKDWGVIVFEIRPAMLLSLQKQRVLLDTNVLIHRESFENVTFEVSSLYKWLDKLNCTKLIHPVSKEEIKKYGEKNIAGAIDVKLQSYETLIPNQRIDSDFDKAMLQFKQDPNGLADNKLLYEVYCGDADVLVTDDKLLLQKAQMLYLSDRVMSVDQFLERAEGELPALIDYKMLSVKKKRFGQMDLNDPFFDSLKEDYPEFEKWFRKKNEEEAYVFESAGIHGFLYLKIETQEESYNNIQPHLPPAKRLKVGTFKIDGNLKGFRLGERFLKIIFDNALKANVDEIYVTMFEGKREEVSRLQNIMTEWGFAYWGRKDNGEAVLVKEMRAYNPGKSPKYNFPNLSPEMHGFFLPIKPEYHTGLFPDAILTDEDMSLYSEEKGHLYSLEKIYVTNSLNIRAKAGDLLVIYRMGTRWPKKYSSVCTSLAVFEEAKTPSTLNDYLRECKNKSIFDEEELRHFYEVGTNKTVVKMILFRIYEKKITLDELQEKDLVEPNGGPRPFESVSDDDLSYFLSNK